MKFFLLTTGALFIFSFTTLPVDGKGHHDDQIEIADNKTYQCNPCCRGPPGRDGRDGPPGPTTTISHVDYVRLKEDLTKDVKQQFTSEVTANQTAVKDNDCPGIGMTQDKPASSCRAIFLCYQHNATSGYYWIKGEIDGNIIIKRVYCNMGDTRCGIRGGWMRVAHIDMTDPDDTCPSPLRTITSPKRMCARSVSTGCSSVTYSTCGIPYTRVCGRAIGYDYGSSNAFSSKSSGINGAYVDGLSITHGHPRKHIWTYAAGISEDRDHNKYHTCPCAVHPGPDPPAFVGDYYHCESGNTGVDEAQWYTDDPLWDGKGCVAGNNCCSTSGLPWFCRTLPCETTDDIEVRWCCSGSYKDNEDIATEVLEIFVV